jgi:hypothetical protein
VGFINERGAAAVEMDLQRVGSSDPVSGVEDQMSKVGGVLGGR